MSNNLSIVHIVSSEYAPLLNELAESFGYGANNLSIPLQNESGTFYGCHSWWTKQKHEIFRDRETFATMVQNFSIYADALDALHEFVVDTEGMTPEQLFNVPTQNANNAYSTLGLVRIDEI